MPEVKLFNPDLATSFTTMSPYVGISLSTGYISQSYSVHPSLLNYSGLHSNIQIQPLVLPNKTGKLKTMLTGYEDCISQTMTITLKFISE